MQFARTLSATFLLAALTFVARARADEPFRYPEAKQGKGELRYVNQLPVIEAKACLPSGRKTPTNVYS